MYCMTYQIDKQVFQILMDVSYLVFPEDKEI